MPRVKTHWYKQHIHIVSQRTNKVPVRDKGTNTYITVMLFNVVNVSSSYFRVNNQTATKGFENRRQCP